MEGIDTENRKEIADESEVLGEKASKMHELKTAMPNPMTFRQTVVGTLATYVTYR